MVGFLHCQIVYNLNSCISTSVGLWAGWTDRENEGIFKDPNNEEHLDMAGGYAPFITGEPNGGRAENCVVKLTDEDNLGDLLWWDYNCKDKSVATCFFEQSSIKFKLRGKNQMHL